MHAPSGPVRIGIDLGGTKIEALAIDAEGRELARKRVASPAHDYALTITTIRDLVAEVETGLGVRARLGIGTPGAVSPATGLVKNANSTQLNGRRLGADLAAALGREVRLANDADCFALSEASDGAGAGRRVVFGAILGTGVGGGLVVDGVLRTGPNAIGGEWGHNEMPSRTENLLPDTLCYCGRRRCIETYVSGPGMAADHARVAGPSSGIDARRIVALASAGDAAAAATLERYARRLASALATMINVVDPDVVVLGGGVSQVDELYAALPRLLGEYVFSDRCDTPVLRNRHGDASGVRGAAWLWPAREAG
jgi:fructokinase